MKTLIITFSLLFTILFNNINNSFNEASTYFYPFTYIDENGVETESLRKVTVIFPYSVINEELHEGIDANDIHTNKRDITNLSNQEIIDLANARAWSLNDGSDVVIQEVLLTKENIKPGASYKVIFSTSKKTQVSVDAYISENDVAITDNKYININTYRSFSPRTLFVYLLFILVLPLLIFSISFTYVGKEHRNTIDLLFKKEEKQKRKRGCNEIDE